MPTLGSASRQHRHSQRPPSNSRLHRLPALPQGPNWLHLRQKPEVVGGPGKAPPGFILPTTSGTEWNAYWALSKVMGSPKDPRKPDAGGFYGGENWRYQRPFAQGQGSAVIDFVVMTATEQIAIRIVTARFHNEAPAFKQMADSVQFNFLGRYYRVVDVQEPDLLGDDTGQKYVLTMRHAISGEIVLPPLTSGVELAA